MDGYCRNVILERIMFYERQFGQHRNGFFSVGQPLKTVNWNAHWRAVTEERHHLFCGPAAPLRLTNGEVKGGGDALRIRHIARRAGYERCGSCRVVGETYLSALAIRCCM